MRMCNTSSPTVNSPPYICADVSVCAFVASSHTLRARHSIGHTHTHAYTDTIFQPYVRGCSYINTTGWSSDRHTRTGSVGRTASLHSISDSRASTRARPPAQPDPPPACLPPVHSVCLRRVAGWPDCPPRCQRHKSPGGVEWGPWALRRCRPGIVCGRMARAHSVDGDPL